MVSVCNTAIKKIMVNFIPHETIICDPTWINNRMKPLICELNSLYKDHPKNNDTQIFEKLTLLVKKLHLAIENRRLLITQICLQSKQKSNLKSYRSVLNRFLNNRKISCIQSLFHENKLVTDFRKNPEILNPFFAKQWSLIYSDSPLPSKLQKKTENSLYSVIFSTEDILKLINNLDSNKAQNIQH